MNHTLKLFFISFFSNLLLIPLIFYFRFFPQIINPIFTNILIIIFVISIFALLAYGSLIISNLKEVIYVLPQILIFILLTMAIPNLRLNYPPLHDPYHYFISTINIINYGSIQEFLGGWYEYVEVHLHWPNMYILSSFLNNITNIDLMNVFRFQAPFIGLFFFLGVFILAKRITKRIGVSLLAALICTFSETIIFYQSEYHPQGLAFVYFIFLLYAYFSYKSTGNYFFGILTILFIFVFSQTHHFSSLFLGLLALIYLIFLNIFSYIPVLRDKYKDLFINIKKDNILWGIITIIMFAYHVTIYPFFMRAAVLLLQGALPSMTLITSGENVPIIFSLLASMKWIVLGLAIISSIYVLRTKNQYEFRAALLLGCILILGFVGTFLIFSPSDRMMGFYIPFASIFASLTIFKIKEEWFHKIVKYVKIPLILIIIILPMTAGFFNSQTPTYYFQNSEQDTFYWYSNDLSSINHFGSVGNWIDNNTDLHSNYATEFDTYIIPFYYGKRPLNQIFRFPEETRFRKIDYYILNPKIPYDYENDFSKRNYISNQNILYDNGEIIISTMT